MEDTTRNWLVSLFSGIIFGTSWWIMIDILALYPQVSSFRRGLLYLPIILSTASFFLNNVIPNSSLVDNFVVTKAVVCHRLLFFIAMVLGFSGMLSAIILSTTNGAPSRLPMYAVVGIPIVNILILLASVTFKFAVVDDEDMFI